MRRGLSQFRWCRHPLAPIAAYIGWSLVMKENYPFSHFSMYSNPSPKPLRFHYLADGEGRPLPVQKHARLSCASMSKKMGTEKGRLEKQDARRSGPSRSPEQIKAEAGRTVLQYVRAESLRQPEKWRLTQPLTIVEVLVTAQGGRAHESHRPVATQP